MLSKASIVASSVFGNSFWTPSLSRLRLFLLILQLSSFLIGWTKDVKSRETSSIGCMLLTSPIDKLGFLSRSLRTRFFYALLFLSLAPPIPETDFGFLSNPVASCPLYSDGCVSLGEPSFASFSLTKLLTSGWLYGLGTVLLFSAYEGSVKIPPLTLLPLMFARDLIGLLAVLLFDE